jgi:gas vesicle protein
VSEKSEKRKSRTVWFIVLGALAGILFAPASGRETRQTIEKGVETGYRYVVSLGHDTREGVDHVTKSGKRIARKVGRL